MQRPVGFQAQDLGMLEKILFIVSLMSALTNPVIIAFHSKWMENIFEEHFEGNVLAARFCFVLAFEVNYNKKYL